MLAKSYDTFVLESRNKGRVLDNIYRFTCRSRHTMYMYIAIIIYTSKFIQQLYILKISIITIASLLYIYICLISGMVAINVSLKTKKHIPYFFSSKLECRQMILDGNSHFKTSRWFSMGNPVSSTNKTVGHNITKILLKTFQKLIYITYLPLPDDKLIL